MTISTTKKSREHMEGLGYHVEKTEWWCAFSQRKHDLFTFADLLCIHKETGDVQLVQSTSLSNVSSRIRKITDSPLLPTVRKAGFGIQVHGWGKKQNRWTLRVEDVS